MRYNSKKPRGTAMLNTNIPPEWLYPATLQDATVIQRELARRVICADDLPAETIIGGMDVSNNPRDPAKMVYASVVVLAKNNLQVIEHAGSSQKQPFPYVSGFLGFREAPALLAAYQKLVKPPRLLFVDGHGVSHPRGLGIASHIGVLSGCATIGVAKSLLVGKPVTELGMQPGDQVEVHWRGQIIAMLLRTRLRANPLIISTGHRVSLPTAVRLVKEHLRGYRLPEPTRQAHLAANKYRIQMRSELA